MVFRIAPGWTIELIRETRPDRIDVFYRVDNDFLDLKRKLLAEIACRDGEHSRSLLMEIVRTWPALIDGTPVLAQFVMELML
jgi:hypothetical protein